MVEINDESREKYKSNQMKFKNSMIWTNLCHYSDGYIFVSATITITGSVDDDDDDDGAEIADERNKEIIFENRGPFSDCISNINNTQI